MKNALLLAGTAGALVPALAAAAEPASTVELPGVVVTARIESAPAFDLPASLDVAHVQAGSARPRTDVSEVLSGVPGLLARDRQNRAQDTQLSIRGFGARATFGVRGLRLYADGIPATAPDGQGQFSHFDLASAGRIEVLRGPFSVLYGNSSGGVISLFTADGGPQTVAEVGTAFGSFGVRRTNVRLSGEEGPWNYHLSAVRFATDGFREHSAAQRTGFNGKVRYALDADTRLTFVLN